MLAVAVSCSPVIFVFVIALSTVAVNGLPLEDDSDPEKIEARRTLVLSLSGGGGVKHDEHDQPADRKRNLQTPLVPRGGGDHEEKEEKEKEVGEEEKGEVKNREESKSRVVGNDRYKSVDRRSRAKSTTTTTTTTERGVVEEEEEEEEEEVKEKVEVKKDEKFDVDKSCQNSENCTKVDRARKVTPSPAAIMSRRQRISNYHSSTTTDSSISTPTPSDQDINSRTAVKKRRRLTTVSTTPTPPNTSAPFPTFNQYPAIEEVPQYDITQFLNFGKKISPETVPTPSGINSIESNKSIRQRTSDRHVSAAEKLSYLTPEEDIVNENMDVTVMKKAIERNTAPRGRIPVRDPVISSSYYRRRPITSSTTLASVQTTDDNLISTTECAAVDSSDTPTKVYRRRSPNFHSATIKTCGEVSGKKVESEKENRTDDVVEKKEVVSVSNRTEEVVDDKVKAKPEVKITDVELVNRRRILKTSANSNRNKFERLQIPRSSSPVGLVASPSMPPVVSTSSPSPLTTVLSAVTESKPQESSTTSSPVTHPPVTDRVMKFRRPSTLPPSTTTPKPSETPKNVSADSHPEHSVDPLQQEESNPYPRNAKPSEAEQSVPQLPISPQPTTRILSTAVVTSVSVKESEQNNTRSSNKTVNVPQQSEPIALINENQNRSSFVDLSRSRINANIRTNFNHNQTGADLNAIRSRDAVLRSHDSSNVQTTSTTEFPQNHKKVEEVEEKQETGVKEVVDQNVNRYPSVNITRTPDFPSTTTASPTTSPTTSSSTSPSTSTTSEPLPTTFRVGIFPSSPVTTVEEHSTVASHEDSDMHNRSTISLSSINNNNTINNRVASESSFADTKDSKFNAPPVEVAPEVGTEEEVETSVVNNATKEDSYNPNLPGIIEVGSYPSDFGIHHEVSNSAPSGFEDQTNDQTFIIPKLHEDHVTKDPPPKNIYETGGDADNEPIPDGGSYNDYDEVHVSNVPNNTRPPSLNHNHNIKWTSSTAGGQFGSTKPAPSHNETPLVDVSSYPENLSITTYLVSALVVIPILLLSILAARIIILRSRRKKVLDDSEYSSEYNRSPLSTTTPSLHTKLPRLATHPSWEIEKNRELPPIPTNNPVTRWEFPREKLRLQTVLGQGNFGQVWKAEADDINGHEGLTRLVAVKTVKQGASLQMREDLLRELGIMQELGAHPNVVTLLGCCTEKEPYLLIMEYVMYGKLLAFLRDHRTRAHYYNFSDATDALTSRDLTVFAYCVARGMDYLTSKSIIHRDLAARNVLVDHNKLCKIADFGMSRNVRDTGQIYEQRQCKGALPIRWMAPESLHFSLYTHKTDVWSFGILMWEIVTLGSTPYASMGAREVMRRVRGGYRLDRPTHCHQTLFRVIGRCWHSEPAKRPTFAELKQQLGDLLADEEHNGNYVDLESLADEMRQTSQSSNSSASTLQRP